MSIFQKLAHRIVRNITDLRKKRNVKSVLAEMASYLHERECRILYVELPISDKIKGLTDFEKERIANWCFDFNKYKEELPKLKKLYGEHVTEEYIMSIFDGGVVVEGIKRKILLDFQSRHQHIINGRRVTTGQPRKYHHTIYTHGACTFRGTGVEDGETIASYLQSLVNKEFADSYKVVNSGIGRGSSIYDDVEYMKEQNYKPGDIVIVGSHGPVLSSISPSFYKKHRIEFIRTSSLFNRPHSYGEWFNDHTLHTNSRGNRVIAHHIYVTLKGLGWLSQSLFQKELSLSLSQKGVQEKSVLTKGMRIYGDNPELIKFLDELKVYKKEEGSLNGCIVMNCNPFTNGHKYLIEYASSRVDNLYIFVVEENKSYFTFEDRFNLVKLGTSHLNNVIVLPSGNFIISAVTFPGYFYKDNLKETKIDCSNDLNVFAQYIAPVLDIKIRFAGEEPLDPVTNQYNEAMGDLLPQYGIAFQAIPRKQDHGEVISASRVRKCLENGDWETIKAIVPTTTFDYLKKRSSLLAKQ